MNRNKTSIFLATLMLAACIPGCIFSPGIEYSECSDDDNCLVIAFELKEEYKNTDESPQKLADRLGELMAIYLPVAVCVTCSEVELDLGE